MRGTRVLVTEKDVLVALALAIPPGEEIVQLGPAITYAAAWQDVLPSNVADRRIGMLHLGFGRIAELDDWMPLLVKGAIVALEGYLPDTGTYNCANDLAARGFITCPSSAKYWPGLGICTYLGGSK